MFIKNDNEVYYLDDEFDHTYNKLHDAFESLYDNIKKFSYKYSQLKKSHACLLIKKNIREESLDCN